MNDLAAYAQSLFGGSLLDDSPSPLAQQIELRDYQQQAISDVLAAWRERGLLRLLVSLPTGAGKTFLAAHLIRATGLARTIFMVHRDELVRQSVRALQQINPDLAVGIVKAEQDQVWADVVVASAQTLIHPRRVERLRAAIGARGLLLISDECHHDAAPGRKRVLDFLEPRLLIGLTATAHRADKLALGAIYQEVVHHTPMLELIAKKMLAPLRGLRVETEADLDEVHTVAGEFNEGELAETVDTDARNRLIVEAHQKHAADRQRTVAFCVNVAHAEHLRDAFLGAGISAERIIGTTPTDERLHIFDDFHRGVLPVLTNCMVLTEGYDEPAIDCILMARPTKSLGLYIQMVGRGARRSPAKQDCLVIDVVDNSVKHRLITLPTLAGLDLPDDAEAGLEATEACREAGQIVDLFGLQEQGRAIREKRAVNVNLFGGSDYLWRDISGYYAAPAGPSSWLMLLPRDDGYMPSVVSHQRDRDPEIQPLFDRSLDIEMAMGIAEAKAPLNALTAREASWRSQAEPFTEAQFRYARVLRVAHLLTPGVTKAQASDILDQGAFLQTITRLRANGELLP